METNSKEFDELVVTRTDHLLPETKNVHLKIMIKDEINLLELKRFNAITSFWFFRFSNFLR